MVAARLLMVSLMALLATSAALTLSASTQPLRSFSRQRVGVVQLVEPSPEVEASEAAEASPATEAAATTGDTEPETVVVEFSSPFGDKSSPIWQKPKPSSSGLPDKETPAALKLVLDYLCAWLVLERSVRGMVRRRPASSATCLTSAPSLRHRGAFRSRGGPVAAFAMRPLRVTAGRWVLCRYQEFVCTVSQRGDLQNEVDVHCLLSRAAGSLGFRKIHQSVPRVQSPRREPSAPRRAGASRQIEAPYRERVR